MTTTKQELEFEMNKPTKPSDIPDKFWDEENGAVRLDALIKSYLSLEQMVSKRLENNDKNGSNGGALTFADHDALLAHLGRPATPDAYCVDCTHGYFSSDSEMNTRMHTLGFNQEQVQFVYDLAAEKFVPMILDIVSTLRAEQETEKLIAHFGGPDNWRRLSRQLLSYGRKSLPQNTFSAMTTSFDGIKALYDLMNTSSRNKTVFGSGDPQGDGDANQLYTLMRDPKYWRDHDPKTVARVTDGFNRLYAD